MKVFYLLQNDNSAMFWGKLCKRRVYLLSILSTFKVDAGTGRKWRNSVVKLYLAATTVATE